MGTMIHLSLGNLEIDWGKNRGFTDHSPLYQTTDVSKVPSWYVSEHEHDDSSWTLYADYNDGYSAPLWKVLERLRLLGYTERVIENYYIHGMSQFDYDGQPVAPDFKTLRKFFASFDFSLLLDDDRKIDRTLGKYLSEQLLRTVSKDNIVFSTLLRDVFDGESIHFTPYTLLYLFSSNLNTAEFPVRWDFDGLVQSGWAPRDEFVRELDSSNRFLIVTEGSSDAAIIRHAFSILQPHIQDFFSYVDMKEGYPFTGTGNVINFVKGLISIGIQNNIIVIFDNDAEGLNSYQKCMDLNVPANMRIVKLPDLEEFREFESIGPEGISSSDINGRAAAIECYLDTGDKPQVRWTNFNMQQQCYQGALISKDDYKRDFLNQRSKMGEYNYTKLNKVLDLIVVTAVDIKERDFLNALSKEVDEGIE